MLLERVPCSHLLARTVQTMQTNALRPFGISVINYYLTGRDNPEFDIRGSVNRLYGSFKYNQQDEAIFDYLFPKRLCMFRADPSHIITPT